MQPSGKNNKQSYPGPPPNGLWNDLPMAVFCWVICQPFRGPGIPCSYPGGITNKHIQDRPQWLANGLWNDLPMAVFCWVICQPFRGPGIACSYPGGIANKHIQDLFNGWQMVCGMTSQLLFFWGYLPAIQGSWYSLQLSVGNNKQTYPGPFQWLANGVWNDLPMAVFLGLFASHSGVLV